LAGRYYPGFKSPSERFDEVLQETLQPGIHVLDAGCGSGKFLQWEHAKRLGCLIVGVDIAAAVRQNPNLDLRVRGDLERLPFTDSTFDVVVCRVVIEHLLQPSLALTEFHRVLTRGGQLLIFTPNLLHYFGLVAKFTPHRFHTWFNRRVRGFEDEDTFPTYYRANTRRSLRRLLASSGFHRVRIDLFEHRPDVLGFLLPLYFLGVAYGRLVRRFEWLSMFRTNIVAVGRKE
jgi:SAM-dependent methyltransferase